MFPQSDERYHIPTPEQVGLAYDVAGLGSRFLAAAVDFVLLALLVVFVTALGGFGLGALLGALSGPAGLDPEWVQPLAGAIASLLAFATLWGYFVFFEMLWQGQSPGKRRHGLRVIREGGYPIRFTDSAIRNVVRLVDFLPFGYLLGALAMFIDGRSRRLGDLAAGTLVVKERAEVTLESLGYARGALAAPEISGDPFAPAAPAQSTIPRLERLTTEDHSLLREYAGRRTSLSEGSRLRLASQLARAFAEKLEYDLGEYPGAFLDRLISELGIGPAGPDASFPGQAIEHPSRKVRPLWLVAALGVASFSLYSMYWLYATWKEIKQERADPDMRPFWHMMALLVPIYGLFRFHAHIRTIKEEAESHSGATSLMPGVCVVLWIVTGLAVLPGLTGQVIPWWVNLLATAVTTVPVVWGQAALNGAWRLAPGGGVPHPFRVWHLAALALGLLFWASVIAQESGLLA